MAAHPARSLADTVVRGAARLSRYIQRTRQPGSAAQADYAEILRRVHGALSHLGKCVTAITEAEANSEAQEGLAAAASLIARACDRIATARPMMSGPLATGAQRPAAPGAAAASFPRPPAATANRPAGATHRPSPSDGGRLGTRRS